MRALAAILLALCLHAHADTAERAQNAAIADVVTTGAALALGAVEVNPLGVVTIPLKIAILSYVETLPDGEKQQNQSAVGAMWSGAAANNLCVLIAIVTGGTFAPACIAAGLVYGVHRWNDSEMEREFWWLCAQEKQSNPAMTCQFTKPGG